MKKILTVLLVAAIAMTSVLATSTQVQLKTSVDQNTASFVLAYNGTSINQKEFILDTQQKLSEEGQTEYFTIKSTSNYIKDQGVTVTVSPQDFILQRNNVSSGIRPTVNYGDVVTAKVIPAGVKNNYQLTKFILEWDGSDKASTLDAGTYVSNVEIVYTAN